MYLKNPSLSKQIKRYTVLDNSLGDAAVILIKKLNFRLIM